MARTRAPISPGQQAALADVTEAYIATRRLQQRLDDQHMANAEIIRTARGTGATWDAIGDAAGLSGVGVLLAAKRGTEQEKAS